MSIPTAKPSASRCSDSRTTEVKHALLSPSVCGPMPPFALGAFHRGFAPCVACRVPARRPGNFHLRPQMKVTKAKGLNTDLVSTPWAPSRTGELDASRCVNPIARSAGPCYACAGHAQAHRHPMQPAQMGIEVVCFGDFHLDQQMFAKRGSAHFAQRSYADTKVTRPPGRDPARNALRNTSIKRAGGRQQQRAESRSPLYASRLAPSALEHLT
jgi:hypothetical protein